MSRYSVVVDPVHGYRRLDPIPTTSEIEAFYENEYYELVQRELRAPDVARSLRGDREADEQRDWMANTLYADFRDLLREHGTGNRVLEVGCGTGDLMMNLREGGFEVTGVEIAATAAEHARQRGLDVHHGSFEDYAASLADGRSFGAVVFMNVLEQLRDPVHAIKLANHVLRPGGIVLIRSGNEFNPLQLAAQQLRDAEPWWVSMPDQINYFSFESLSKLLATCGFSTAYAQSDFPMELFLLMGDDYVGTPEVGRACHRRRVAFENNLPTNTRRALYRAFAEAGIGRCTLMVGRCD